MKLIALRKLDQTSRPSVLSRRVEDHTGSTVVRKPPEHLEQPRFRAFGASQLDQIPQLSMLTAEQRFAMRVVAAVLPFRTNEYVVDELIDWTAVPDDPVFQLTFPQRGMLSDAHFDRMAALLSNDPSKLAVKVLAGEIRRELNPHPAGQLLHNVPRLDGEPVPGMQHKYPETVLFFPAQGQTCHAYCSFCFRWAQFIGNKELKLASISAERLVEYLRRHPQVTDALITGGDPMVMRTKVVRRYLRSLCDPDLAHVQSIRIGSKSLSFWPQRFVTDHDADELLRLFERLVVAGKHVAFMAHINHWRELDSTMCRRAIRRLRSAGVVIRAQAPLLRHVNDSAEAWASTWRHQVALGIVPYYMFVERDTGARCYFEVPLCRTFEIYRNAITRVSGLARTARGPSMSAGPGKVEIQGISEIAGEKVFVLRFIQARNPAWVQRPFFARYDEQATWLDQLVPAFGEEQFFFQEEYQRSYGATDLK